MDSGIMAYLMVGSRSLAVDATVKQSGRIATLNRSSDSLIIPVGCWCKLTDRSKRRELPVKAFFSKARTVILRPRARPVYPPNMPAKRKSARPLAHLT